MTEVTLHPTPAWRDVVREQIRIVGLSLRRETLVAAVFFAIATAIVLGEILLGGRGFDSVEPFPTPLLSFFFPFIVWRSDRRFAPAFLWTFPVDRRRLALAKVFAGWVWIMAALAFFAAWLLVLALAAGAPLGNSVLRVPFITTTVTYLFGSALVLGFRHPWRWLIGSAGVLFLLGNLIAGLVDAADLPEPQLFMSTVDAAETAVQTHPYLAWAIASALGLALGLAALLAAASRHRENR